MDSEILFIGNTTYDTLGILKTDINPSIYNELTQFGYSFGGKAANAAVYCANLGGKAAYVGTVGSDFESIGYRKYLEDHSVDITDVFYINQKTPRFFSFRSEATTYSFVSPSKLSKNQLNHLRDHLNRVVSERPAKIVYCAISNEELILDIFTRARMKGIRTAWNPLVSLSSLKREQIERILRETDLLFVNSQEFADLESSMFLSPSDFYTSYGIAIICITLGEMGCKIVDKGIITNIPTIKVDVIDTIGAGDAFAGTFLAATQLFNTTKLCAELACIAGSLVVEGFGAQVNMFNLDQLNSLRSKILGN